MALGTPVFMPGQLPRLEQNTTANLYREGDDDMICVRTAHGEERLPIRHHLPREQYESWRFKIIHEGRIHRKTSSFAWADCMEMPLVDSCNFTRDQQMSPTPFSDGYFLVESERFIFKPIVMREPSGAVEYFLRLVGIATYPSPDDEAYATAKKWNARERCWMKSISQLPQSFRFCKWPANLIHKEKVAGADILIRVHCPTYGWMESNFDDAPRDLLRRMHYVLKIGVDIDDPWVLGNGQTTGSRLVDNDIYFSTAPFTEEYGVVQYNPAIGYHSSKRLTEDNFGHQSLIVDRVGVVYWHRGQRCVRVGYFRKQPICYSKTLTGFNDLEWDDPLYTLLVFRLTGPTAKMELDCRSLEIDFKRFRATGEVTLNNNPVEMGISFVYLVYISLRMNMPGAVAGWRLNDIWGPIGGLSVAMNASDYPTKFERKRLFDEMWKFEADSARLIYDAKPDLMRYFDASGNGRHLKLDLTDAKAECAKNYYRHTVILDGRKRYHRDGDNLQLAEVGVLTEEEFDKLPNWSDSPRFWTFYRMALDFAEKSKENPVLVAFPPPEVLAVQQSLIHKVAVQKEALKQKQQAQKAAKQQKKTPQSAAIDNDPSAGPSKAAAVAEKPVGAEVRESPESPSQKAPVESSPSVVKRWTAVKMVTAPRRTSDSSSSPDGVPIKKRPEPPRRQAPKPSSSSEGAPPPRVQPEPDSPEIPMIPSKAPAPEKKDDPEAKATKKRIRRK